MSLWSFFFSMFVSVFVYSFLIFFFFFLCARSRLSGPLQRVKFNVHPKKLFSIATC